MTKPLTLSIIIPAYNEENHLADCLDSIAAQTVVPHKVIVVDNNSTDGTADIADRYPFVKIIQEKQQGIVYARDGGFNAANSDLIGRIDADTVLPPEWVERVMAFYSLSGHELTCLTGGATFRNMPMPRFSGWLQRLLAFRLSWLALGHHILWGSNMVIPAEVWKEVRGQVCHLPHIHEDIDLAIHVHEAGAAIAYKPKLTVSTIMRRVLADRSELWYNLKWWPRTLRRHHKKRWVIALGSASWVYVLAQVVRLITAGRDSSE